MGSGSGDNCADTARARMSLGLRGVDGGKTRETILEKSPKRQGVQTFHPPIPRPWSIGAYAGSLPDNNIVASKTAYKVTYVINAKTNLCLREYFGDLPVT